MILSWKELNEYDEIVTKQRSLGEINLKNVKDYAKKNCKKCLGRGYSEFDLGKKWWYVSQNYREHFHYELSRRNIACDCVIRNLDKLQNLEREKTKSDGQVY